MCLCWVSQSYSLIIITCHTILVLCLSLSLGALKLEGEDVIEFWVSLGALTDEAWELLVEELTRDALDCGDVDTLLEESTL